MRLFLLVSIFAASTIPAVASKRVTVDELVSILVEQKRASKTDEETARRISNLELTERLSPDRLTQLETKLPPGPKTALALTLLGDVSAFLDPPAAELPSLGRPDSAAQKAMLHATFEYVASSIRRLPDFLAKRITRSFDDSPRVPTDFGVGPLRGGPLLGPTITQEVTYRNGREELSGETPQREAKQSLAPTPIGLTSWGEFGALPAIVLHDSVGELTWSHWERDASGVAAVFGFGVPAIASHYLLDYCCVRSSEGLDLDHPYIRRETPNSYKARPAYHGSLSIDPRTGAILRITLRAELKASDPISQMDVAVQFGSVNLGDTSYICPVHSVAISSTLVGSDTSAAEWRVLRVNDVSFTDYHKFGSTIRVLPGISEPR